MSAVSYIDENKTFRTYRLPLIQVNGCSNDLYSRLRYAKTMCEKLIMKLDSKGGIPVVPGVVPQNDPTPAATMKV
jgi:polo-like kinase 1